VEDLKQVLCIPSVSTDVARKGEVERCARYIADELKRIGMTSAEVLPTAGHPIVYAEWLGAPGKPTVLLYGHYDVQPPEPLEKWETPPFEPTIRGGALYARGACDDKGQVYMHVKAAEAHLKVNGKLPVNLKMVLEGEEEVGSENLEDFLRRHTDRVRADVLVVSDTGMLDAETPAICYGLRGIVYAQIDLVGPRRDLHSGEYGGAVPNPCNALAALLTALKDGDGRITVPGMYDRVRPLGAEEKEAFRRLPFDAAKFLGDVGVKVEVGEKGYSTLERIWARPTLDVNGMWGGFIGEGSKTVIASEAHAKVSMRLVPDQDPDDIFRRFEAYVKKLAPAGTTVTVQNMHGARPFLVPPEHPSMRAAQRALERAWKKPAVLVREGGSIPVMNTFSELLKLPCLLLGFGLPDDQIHAPNEKYSLTSFHGGTRSVAYLYEELARG
jgi:acetylornithine deacetylase/succinyl-diaminopimelate desuccinylase-like protein